MDFPLFEWDDETQRYYAMHHPFTSPKPEDVQYIDSDPGRVRANAYDFVCNGTEIGGGSIRIHDSKLQAKMFEVLGFTAEQAQLRFGFLMDAFKYGAPPRGGLAFGFDRLCSLFGGRTRSAITSPSRAAAMMTMMQPAWNSGSADLADRQSDAATHAMAGYTTTVLHVAHSCQKRYHLNNEPDMS